MAIVLAIALSCSEYTTSTMATPDGVIRVKVNMIGAEIPDSVKEAMMAASAGDVANLVSTGQLSAALRSPVSTVASASLPACGGGDGFVGYTKSKVDFAPEAIPNIAPYPLADDGVIPDSDVPLGFNFSFQGNTYNKVNVYMNGFLLFGTRPSPNSTFFSDAGSIAALANPNNLIALAWTDWSPQLVSDGIRWETRGAAPNRRFILQFNNVPEYFSASKPGAILPNAGRLTSQVVLSEGSNDITIYTNTLTVKNSSHTVTQGLENGDGTVANYDSVLNVNTGIWSRRVRLFFNLQNDAVRFSPISTKDDVAPSFPAFDNLTANNDPGLGSAVVAVAPPGATDNCSAVTLTFVRSDGATSLDAPYKVGVTTITWTAKDADGNTSTATQTVTVLDVEAPVFGAKALSTSSYDATSPAGAVVTYDVNVTDNVGVKILSCQPASGSVLPIGPTEVDCTASDAAGNSSSTSFFVSVIGAHEQIGNLMGLVSDMGLANGKSNPMLNQLNAAYRATAGDGEDTHVACVKMGDFISMLQKKGGNLPSAVLNDAEQIEHVLGCS